MERNTYEAARYKLAGAIASARKLGGKALN
jgi:hypothetical protein